MRTHQEKYWMKAFLTIALAASALSFGVTGSVQAQMASPSPKATHTPAAKASPKPAAKTPTAVKPAPAATTKAPAKTSTPKGPAAAPQPNGPGGATAKCKDGTYSKTKTRSGACAGHKGVAQWY
jgi:hypothetical protein